MITLMYSNWAPSAAHLRRLQQLAGAAVAVASDEQSALALGPATRVVLGHRWLRQLLPHAPQLQWVQTTAGGYDQLPWRELAARGITLTRNPLNAPAIAQHAIALAWALLRRIPAAVHDQEQGRWAAPYPMLPLPRSALVLGLGAIGSEAARLLRGLGVRVRGSARSGTAAQRAACDEFVDAAHWRDVLGDTDLLVLALPLDAQTRECVGARELAALPAHAIVVNVGRGGLLDLAALIDALNGGRLGGAALDVLDTVPPSHAAFWHTPNLLVTPKVAAYHPAMQAGFEAFAEDQVRRFLGGAALEHAVDLAEEITS